MCPRRPRRPGGALLLSLVVAAGCTDAASGGAPRRSRFAAIEVAVTVNGRPAPGLELRFAEHSRTSDQQPFGDFVIRPTGADGVARADSLAPGTWMVSEPYTAPLRMGPCTARGDGFNRENDVSDSLRLDRGDRVALRLEITCPYAALLADSALRSELDTLRTAARDAAFGGEPLLTGKVLVADEDGIDRLTFELPEELRPRRSEEVGTVAVVFCQSQVVGVYGGPGPGGPASREVCDVVVVDRVRREPIARAQFSADPAARVQTPAGHLATDVGDRPDREMVEYLLRGRSATPPP